MNNPLVSVIMSCYNETEKDLRDSIESILNQSYNNFEFIIVNDNPNNTSLMNTLNSYRSKDSRVKLIVNPKNIGLSASLNRALQISKGYYIARMDADDISYQDRLIKQVNYLESNSECDLVATNRDDIDENSNIIRKSSSIIIPDKLIPIVLKYGAIITHPSIMVKSNIIKKFKGYRAFRSAQDYDLWLRMVSINCKFHIISEPLLKYRIRQNSITNSNFAKSYFEFKYIKKLFFERMKKSNQDSYSDDAFYKMTLHNQKKHFQINNQFQQLNQIKKNVYKPFILLKILFGAITDFDCFNNLKNLILAKLIIFLHSLKTMN